MAGRISERDVRRLRERADLAAIVGQHTTLSPQGSRLVGLCCFHEERTPSMTVDPARGLYHCFGCGVGGDVYDFLQRMEALSFPEAVERLARIEGYELTYEELGPREREALGRRTRLAQALAEAARFYRERLAGEEGAEARAYLARRGVGEELIERFGVGYAPDGWDALTRHLQQVGWGHDDVVAAGLGAKGGRGVYDRLRGRIVFPIRDAAGSDVLAFGGRVVPGVELVTAGRDHDPPKYLNTPETDVYRKSRALYGLDLARAAAQRADEVLVVEGYLDVIALHGVGVTNVVATCGTALTEEHFRQLGKHARRVVLALDADDAGRAAADRARERAEQAGVRELAVLPMPEGTDPADLAGMGREAVDRARERQQTAVEFQIEQLLRTEPTDSPEAAVAAYRRTFPLLARIGDRALRYTYIRDVVAPAVRIPADRVEAELDAELARRGREARRAASRPRAPAPGPDEPDDDRPLGEGEAPADQAALERELLQAALQAPDELPEEWAEVAERELAFEISRMLLRALRAGGTPDLHDVLDRLPDDDTRERVRRLAVAEPTVPHDRARLTRLVATLRYRASRRRAREVRERLAGGDDADWRELLAEVQHHTGEAQRDARGL